jgi:hypothetical protein
MAEMMKIIHKARPGSRRGPIGRHRRTNPRLYRLQKESRHWRCWNKRPRGQERTKTKTKLLNSENMYMG